MGGLANFDGALQMAWGIKGTLGGGKKDPDKMEFRESKEPPWVKKWVVGTSRDHKPKEGKKKAREKKKPKKGTNRI